MGCLSGKSGLKGEQVAIVLDDDVQPIDAAQAIFDEYKRNPQAGFATFSFSTRKKCLPLQCADLIVGEFRKAWLKAVEGGTEAGFLTALNSRLIVHGRGAHWSFDSMRQAEKALARSRNQGSKMARTS